MDSTVIIAISAVVGIVSGILSAIGTVSRIFAGLETRVEEKQELKRQLALEKQKGECAESLHGKLDDIDKRIQRIEKAVNGKNGKT